MSSSYQMYLKSEDTLRLPVLPDEISVSYGMDNSKLQVCGVGEVTILQDTEATNISFSSVFPKKYFGGCNYENIPEPKDAVAMIQKMIANKKPVRFTLTGGMGLSMYCSIESFNVSERGGDVGSIYYDIKLKEYRTVTMRQIKVNVVVKKAKITTPVSRVDPTPAPAKRTYTVKSGDCLWNIAKKYYGNGSKYTIIYNANKGVIGGNPNLIYPGQVYTIP